ncbi:MAG: hypothetical protein Q8O52_04020 [Sulfuritalea sp.]|nr:hypothetical protein [Sulfuritalea sp.]
MLMVGATSGSRAGTTSPLLERLVALNTQRRAEEAQGHIRWLRPEFQNPNAQAALVGATLVASGGIAGKPAPTEAGGIGAAAAPLPWPPTLPEQLAAVARILADSSTAQTEAHLAANFTGKGRWKSRLPDILAALEALDRTRRLDDGQWLG